MNAMRMGIVLANAINLQIFTDKSYKSVTWTFYVGLTQYLCEKQSHITPYSIKLADTSASGYLSGHGIF